MKTKQNKKVVGVYLDEHWFQKLQVIAQKNRRSVSMECAIRLEKSLQKEK